MQPTPAEIGAVLDAFNQGRMAEAEELASAITRAHPGAKFGWSTLGTILARQGRTLEALVPLQRSAELFPDNFKTQMNLGTVFHELRRFAEAEASFRCAVALKPDHAGAHNNLGAALLGQQRLFEAETSFRQAIVLNPAYAEAHSHLGFLLYQLHRLSEAEASFRQSLALNPNQAKVHQGLIFTLDLATYTDTASQQAERKRWAARFAPAPPGGLSFSNSPDPGRRLRIGYVSGDFKMHSAARVFGAMLIEFDAGEFEVFAYSNLSVTDDITALFQRSVTHWREIARLSDDAAAALIREDGIDILVDLSGYSTGNRLGIFARKAAPIQITAWGYLTGTGMEAMDVLFSDPVLIPEDETRFYAEKVRYLPNAIGAHFPHELPEVGGLPSSSNGALMFGSFNRMCKVSDESYAAWARVLRALPESRFLIKTGEMDDPHIRHYVLKRFADAGIESERIILMGKTSWSDHMLAFNRIDIALDPFPHGGGVTTLEGLMMGVPVVTLKWPTIVGRVSATILTTLGLTDWIAASPDEYVEIAVRKAGERRELEELRRNLRSRLRASIIGDARAYAASVEREYRALWRAWCERP